jgi:[acyl-carrier-protein] S-malonyltransferase
MESFIFPGQGSQAVGMGKDIYDQFESVKEIYQQANKLLSFDIADISFNGPEETLNQTQYTQPALYVHSYAMAVLLQKHNISPDVVAGHSLGEYTALAIANVVSFEIGLNLVKKRGELMQHAGNLNPGSMAAIIGLDFKNLKSLCQKIEADTNEIVRIANYNSSSQVVVSGTIEGIKQIMTSAKTEGAKRVLELKVSGAFHSPLMQSAAEEFISILDSCEFAKPDIPVFSNSSGSDSMNPLLLKDNLKKQITHSVLWVQIIEEMLRQGVVQFYEIGSGSVLTGLMRKIDKQAECAALNTLETLYKMDIVSQ